MPIVFSVVVCTYNRSDMLKGCLESLCQQSLDRRRYEVIVVDNNSTDDTVQVVEEFLKCGNFHYILETKLGLCAARNRGWREARGEYIAYIDDDARAGVNWLEVADSLVKSLQPDLDCLGGPYHPFYTSPRPAWFLDKYEIRDFGDVPKYLERGRYVSGSNMIWSKNALNRIGGFNEKIGIVGNTLELGDETDAIDRLWRTTGSARLYVSPNLIIYHWVPDFKMKVFYPLKRKFIEGQYQATQVKVEGRLKQLEYFTGLIYLLLKANIRFIMKFSSHSFWQNWVVEDGARMAFYTGKVLGAVGVRLHASR